MSGPNPPESKVSEGYGGTPSPRRVDPSFGPVRELEESHLWLETGLGVFGGPLSTNPYDHRDEDRLG